MLHPELAPAMMGRAQQLDDQKQAADQAAAMTKVGQAAFFDPTWPSSPVRPMPRSRWWNSTITTAPSAAPRFPR